MRVRGHLGAVDPETAKSLGLYDEARQLTEERTGIEKRLRTLPAPPEFPPLPELRSRIAAEFDRLEEVLASGTLEERRTLVGGSIDQTKTKPEVETVCISLYPGLSQMVAGAGFEPATFGL